MLHKWLSVEYQTLSGKPEVEEHYWSQLTKDEIRRLHDKYRLDHELFGFSPEYYIAMGQDEISEKEDDEGNVE